MLLLLIWTPNASAPNSTGWDRGVRVREQTFGQSEWYGEGHLDCICVEIKDVFKFESLYVNITFKTNISATVGRIYRPSNSSTFQPFGNDFSKQIMRQFTPTYVSNTGDFNFDYSKIKNSI